LAVVPASSAVHHRHNILFFSKVCRAILRSNDPFAIRGTPMSGSAICPVRQARQDSGAARLPHGLYAGAPATRKKKLDGDSIEGVH
jgi:hypothetical protein